MKTWLQVIVLMAVGLIWIASSCGSDQDFAEIGGIARTSSSPVWSSDGLYVIFSREPSGLFIVQRDGSRLWSLPSGSPLGTWNKPGSFSPALSPDGSRLAYAAFFKNESKPEIVTSALDGSARRKLTDNNSFDAHPTWSPDGTRIAFLSDREDWFGVYVMDADGDNVRRIAPGVASSVYPPTWSPVGDRIAFVARMSEATSGSHQNIVYIARADGAGVVGLGETMSVPAWSTDGSRIAFLRDEEEKVALISMSKDGGEERLLSRLARETAFYDNLSWSPDDSEILYGRSGYAGFGIPVTIVSVDDHSWRVIPEPTLGKGAGAWSPDGSRIAFHNIEGNSDAVLYTTARDGSDARVLVRGSAERLVAEHSNWQDVSADITACSDGYVVARPDEDSGLVQDCEVLLSIRNELAGDAVLNWSADVPIADWQGVHVGGDPPRVVRFSLISLEPSPLTGTIPPGLGRLTGLEYLALDFNRLSGGIPPELGNLQNLRVLSLSSNPLGGTIPPELGKIASLESLELNSNKLEGGIPTELGNLSDLRQLWLAYNRLSGPIPTELWTLTNLTDLSLDYNNLSGCIPSELPFGVGLRGVDLVDCRE